MKQYSFLLGLLIVSLAIQAQNVGIGTNTPQTPLHIAKLTDTALLLIDNQNPMNTGINNGIYFKIGNRYTGAVKTIGTSATDARMGLYTYSVGSPNNMIEHVSILDDGRVGIGITTPTSTLDVDGTVRIRGGGAANGAVLTSDANGTASWQASPTSPSFNTAFSVSSTTSVIASTGIAVKVLFNNKVGTRRFDDGNNFNVTNNSFIVPSNGVYTFTVNVEISDGTSVADGLILLSLLVNQFTAGSAISTVQSFAGKPLPKSIPLTVILKLSTGDAVTASFLNSTGGPLTTSITNATNFSGYRLY